MAQANLGSIRYQRGEEQRDVAIAVGCTRYWARRRKMGCSEVM